MADSALVRYWSFTMQALCRVLGALSVPFAVIGSRILACFYPSENEYGETNWQNPEWGWRRGRSRVHMLSVRWAWVR